ncbi:MAG: type III pantothenate kinase [Deltaproteobacteria bacterium]|nr:type III pantothenate kinase [Deltaproteobacteria bacterium]
MLLAIDIGNSNIVFGLFDEEKVRSEWRADTRRDLTVADLAKELRRGLHSGGIPSGEIGAAIVCSVVPPLDTAIAGAAKQVTGQTVLFVDHTNAGVPIKYPHPEEVGADRLADAAGAYDKYGGPCIVVDFGTATTFDYIDGDGAYHGGPIAPGLALGSDALAAAAAKLDRTPIAATEHLLPRTTSEAIQAGVFHGHVGLAQYLISRLTEDVGGHPKTIATGGLASLIAPHCPLIAVVDPRLTLDGLRVIWKRRG